MADLDLARVVRGGNTRESLEALRDRLAVELESASGASVAALAKQLADVLKSIDTLPSGKERSLADDLADRREARVANADSQKRSVGSAGRRRGGRRSGGTGGS